MYCKAKRLLKFVLFGTFFITPTVWAGESANLTNLILSIPELMRLVTAIAYVCGMMFIIKGLMELKHFGETRSMYSTREHGFTGPLVYLFVGSALLYLPTSVQMMTTTFFSNTLPLAYIDEETGMDLYYLNSGYLIIELIGTIAFIKGFFLLSTYGAGRAAQGAFKTAITHIIGGVFCINIVTCLQVIFATFGLSTALILSS